MQMTSPQWGFNGMAALEQLRFCAPLISTDTVLYPERGVGPATFSRASAQYITDFEGVTRKVGSSSVAVEGSRVVTNLLTYSEDLSNAAWAVGGGASKESNNVISFPSLEDQVYQGAAQSITTGYIARFTVTLSGSGYISIKIRRGGIETGEETVKRISLSVTPTRYSVSHTFSYAHTSAVGYIIRNTLTFDTATSVTVHNAQLENVTAQSNQNPGEYVRTTSSALSQCFSTTNGNTVDASGVVTEATGTSLPQAYPERVNTNTYGLNDRIQVAGWWYQCTTLGISAGSAPTFPQGKAGTQTVTDGSVVWTIGGRLLLGYVSEPASTNKVTAYGIIPADALGSELITVEDNRTFASDTGWWTKNGTTISDGTCNYSAITATAPYRSALATEGKVYQVTYTVTSVTSGSIVGRVGGVNGLTPRTTPGTYTDTILAGASSNAIGLAANNFTGSIDNVSIKEVGWAVGTKSFYNGSSFVQNITGLTLSGGDTAAVLSIVTDQTEIEKAGLAGINPGYKVYKLDNSAGATSSVVAVTGTVGNTNKHSISIVARASAGTFRMIDASGTWGYVTTTLVPYTRIKTVDKTPASTLDYLLLSATAGSVTYFLLPQLEELSYATSPMISLGSTSTRAATSDSYPSANNLKTKPCSGVFYWTPNMSGGSTTRWLWGSYTDSNNALGVFYDGTNITFRKRVGGSNYDATKALTCVAGTTYRIGWRINNDGSTDVFLNGVKGTGSADTHTAVIASTFKLGDEGDGTDGTGGAELRNWKVWFRAMPDSSL